MRFFKFIPAICLVFVACATTTPQTSVVSSVTTGGTSTQNNTIYNLAVQQSRSHNQSLTALKTDIELQANLLRNLKQFLRSELDLTERPQKGVYLAAHPAPFDRAVYNSVRTDNAEALAQLSTKQLNSLATFYNLLAQINRELDNRLQISGRPLSQEDFSRILELSDKNSIGMTEQALALTSDGSLSL